MVDECADRRGQAPPRREDEVDDSAMPPPVRQHTNELSVVEGLPAQVVGQKSDSMARNSRITNGSKVAASHTWLMLNHLTAAVVGLQIPFHQIIIIGRCQGWQGCELVQITEP